MLAAYVVDAETLPPRIDEGPIPLSTFQVRRVLGRRRGAIPMIVIGLILWIIVVIVVNIAKLLHQ